MSGNSRFASIEGTLSQRSKARPTLITSEPDAETEDTSPQSEKAEAKPQAAKPARTQRSVAPASASTGGTRRIAFRLDAELHDSLTKRVAVDGTTQAYVVLDAIESAYAAGALDQEQHSEPATTGSLFARPKGRKPAIPAVPTEIRVDSTAQDQIDTMVKTYDFESRTQLIAVALRHHLV
jgi:hypothetical protein